MAIYEIIKDCISTAQKADNIPLVQILIEAQKQILDLLNENYNLREENKINSANIERHKDAYITLKNDKEKIIYCSCCYDRDGKLVQAQVDEENGRYWCHVCKYQGYFDKKKYDLKHNTSYYDEDTFI